MGGLSSLTGRYWNLRGIRCWMTSRKIQQNSKHIFGGRSGLSTVFGIRNLNVFFCTLEMLLQWSWWWRLVIPLEASRTASSKPLKNAPRSQVGPWPLDVGLSNTYQSVSTALTTLSLISDLNDDLVVKLSSLYSFLDAWRFIQTTSRWMGKAPWIPLSRPPSMG